MHQARRGGVVPVRAVFLLLAALALASGCSAPKVTSTYEYLSDYRRMGGQYDPLVSLVYIPQPIVLSQYRGIIVGTVSVGQEWVDSREDALGYATLLRLCLLKRLTLTQSFEYVTLDSKEDGGAIPEAGMLRLEGMVTRFDMGSGFLRYFSGFIPFLSLGTTDLQFEGRLTEADTGKTVVEFADRRRHHCNTPFGPNPRNFKEGYAMNVTTEETATCFARFMAMACKGLPADDAEFYEAYAGVAEELVP